MYIAPKSTESQNVWGSTGTTRGTISTTNGVSNTNTLYSFGTSAHPPAGVCKTLTTGGYNTWYLPASNELVAFYSSKLAVPSADRVGQYNSAQVYWSSTEQNGSYAYAIGINASTISSYHKGTNYQWYGYFRAVRRALV